MLTNKSGSQSSRASSASGVLLRDKERAGARRDKRAYARHAIESCRTIALRRLDDDRQPTGRWFLADVADVGVGGMCLVASKEQSLEIGQWLLMDLRAHPGFGQLRMQAQLRWLTRAHFALTFGVAFATPLKDVPVLSVERRSTRRDPNQEDWAIEEERALALS
ncbi:MULTISPECIES: PilZ domain-containing protein [unclassified Cyanobium]|uniref:PilZ domain-containing protein n=1 Tax=unclassified Cyanobium TaxID=2627006 RepID=UPI0020CCF7FA|nr:MULTISPECIES: PilZ domain-containing protein [unclassified Cyanobium]MCP9835357.1 PilZ domain-containing protein [Cyanobium sp. La Preciosa 7G6]MCP9938125.1 PilZ domain-containing protein [Cyanobium sp. Aljojuca 7A6]